MSCEWTAGGLNDSDEEEAFPLGRAIGALPSGPFVLRKRFEVHIDWVSWAAVNGVRWFVNDMEGICWKRDREVQGGDIRMDQCKWTQNAKTFHGTVTPIKEFLLQKKRETSRHMVQPSRWCQPASVCTTPRLAKVLTSRTDTRHRGRATTEFAVAILRA